MSRSPTDRGADGRAHGAGRAGQPRPARPQPREPGGVEIDELEGEHRDFAESIAALDVDAADFTTRVAAMLDDLEAHVEREDLGVFPVSVVTLGVSGRQVVDDAQTNSPSFLLDAQPQPDH